EKVARAGVELRDLHQWCVADQRKDLRRLIGRNRRRWRSLNHSKRLLDLRLAFVRPLRLAVLKKLLQDWKADFAVVPGVTQVAAPIQLCFWDSRKRHTSKLLDVILAARAGIGQDREVRLIG